MAPNILVGKFLFGKQLNPGWMLDQIGVKTTTPPFLKSMSFDVDFHASFAAAPVVVLNVYQLQADLFDAYKPKEPAPKIRYALSVVEARPGGFTVNIRAWDATRLFYVGGVWTAFQQGVIDGLPFVGGDAHGDLQTELFD